MVVLDLVARWTTLSEVAANVFADAALSALGVLQYRCQYEFESVFMKRQLVQLLKLDREMVERDIRCFRWV